MKSITKISLAVLMVLVALPTASAQPGNRPHNPSQQWNNGPHRGGGIEKILPDLTEDQLTSLKELRLDHYKKMKDYRNKMGEVQAKQRTIISAYKIDEKAAAVLIDEKTDIMNQQMKEQVAHKVSVNSILTEEQVLKLEQHRKQRIAHRGGKGNFGSGCQNGPRHGKGPGAGRNL